MDNYLDDIWFLADTAEKNLLQMIVAEWWAECLGIELNVMNREPTRTITGHMGFSINLREKVIGVTQRNQQKIMELFYRFLWGIWRKGRIPVREIQRMLELQI